MLELLYQALASKRGIVIAVSDVQRVRAKLYAARRDSGDPELNSLTIHLSPYNPTSELMIVRRAADAETRDGAAEEASHPPV